MKRDSDDPMNELGDRVALAHGYAPRREEPFAEMVDRMGREATEVSCDSCGAAMGSACDGDGPHIRRVFAAARMLARRAREAHRHGIRN